MTGPRVLRLQPREMGEVILFTRPQVHPTLGTLQRMCTCDVAKETEQGLWKERGAARAGLPSRTADSLRFCYQVVFTE